MNRKTTLTMTFAAGLLSLLAACGGGSEPESPANGDNAAKQSSEGSAPEPKSAKNAPPAACELVSQADVAAIMGEAMKPGESSGQQKQSYVTIDSCTWLGATAKSQALASVFVRNSSGDEAKSTFERTRTQFADAVGVDGFGEGAYYVPSNGQLNILRGEAWVIVTASHEGLSNPDTLTEEHRSLAAAALKAL